MEKKNKWKIKDGKSLNVHILASSDTLKLSLECSSEFPDWQQKGRYGNHHNSPPSTGQGCYFCRETRAGSEGNFSAQSLPMGKTYW